MIRLLGCIPRSIFLAVSGGPDSMAALDFLRRCHSVTALHFNHGTKHGADAETFVREYTDKENITCLFGKIKTLPPAGVSKEHWWREARYEFFREACGHQPLVICHNLDDAMETWLFTTTHGTPRLIPYSRDNIIRPFLLTRKKKLQEWCDRHRVPYVLDPSNEDEAYARARVRKLILPEILKLNPGFPKTVSKKYLAVENRAQP
jgi:tRNA(Ile)-lysidine synthase